MFLFVFAALLQLSGASSSQYTLKFSSGHSFIGFETETTINFRSIPYATARRFEHSTLKRYDDSETSRHLNFTAGCIQFCSNIVMPDFWCPRTMSDDCLSVNVYIPKGAPANGQSKFPLVMWLHGGLNIAGIGGQESLDGTVIAAKTRAIYFIPNYRVNYGGYLATSPSEGGLKGNYGLLDQARVLEWMRLYGGEFVNAEGYRGDANNIALTGDSAGGRTIFCHLTQEYGKGLFDKVVIQSAAGLRTKTPAKIQLLGSWMLNDRAVTSVCGQPSSSNSYLECIRTMDVEKLNTAAANARLKFTLQDWFNGLLSFSPSIDGEFVKSDCYSSIERGRVLSKVPIIIGDVENEGTNLVQAFFDFVSSALGSSQAGQYMFGTGSVFGLLTASDAASVVRLYNSTLDKSFGVLSKDMSSMLTPQGLMQLAKGVIQSESKDYRSDSEIDPSTRTTMTEETWGDFVFSCPTRRAALSLSTKGGLNIWKFVTRGGFSWMQNLHTVCPNTTSTPCLAFKKFCSPKNTMCHAEDIPWQFGTAELFLGNGFQTPPSEVAQRDVWHGFLSSFFYKGTPDESGLVWPPLSAVNEVSAVLGLARLDAPLEYDAKREKCELWETVSPSFIFSWFELQAMRASCGACGSNEWCDVSPDVEAAVYKAEANGLTSFLPEPPAPVNNIPGLGVLFDKGSSAAVAGVESKGRSSSMGSVMSAMAPQSLLGGLGGMTSQATGSTMGLAALQTSTLFGLRGAGLSSSTGNWTCQCKPNYVRQAGTSSGIPSAPSSPLSGTPLATPLATTNILPSLASWLTPNVPVAPKSPIFQIPGGRGGLGLLGALGGGSQGRGACVAS